MLDYNLYIAVIVCILIFAYAAYQVWALGQTAAYLSVKIRNKNIQLYHDYKNGLSASDGQGVSFQKAEETLTLENLFRHENVNIRHYLAIPSQLIGIGVLFTFVGLAMGLAGFDMAHLEQSIERFISALSIKFLTSIAGMSSAILYNLLEKNKFHQVEMELNKLCQELDAAHYQPYGRYLEICLQPFALQQNRQLEAMAERIRLNGKAFHQVHQDIQAIKDGMAQLSDNLRLNIDRSFREINAQIAAYNTRQFEDMRQSSEHALTLLQSLFEASSSKLNEQLEKWHGYLAVQDDVISKANQSMAALPDALLKNLRLVQAASDEINVKITTYSATWTDALILQKDAIDGITETLRDTLPLAMQSVDVSRDLLRQESLALKQQVAELNTAMASGLATISGNIDGLNQVVAQTGENAIFLNAGMGRLLDGINAHLEQLAHDIVDFGMIAEQKFNQPLAQFDSSVQTLGAALARLDRHTARADALNADISALDTDIKDASQQLRAYQAEIRRFNEKLPESAQPQTPHDSDPLKTHHPVYFSVAPDIKNNFNAKLFAHKLTGDAMYKIAPIGNSKVAVEFELIDSPDSVSRGLLEPESLLFRACENENPFSRNATKIITVAKGRAIKQGDKWHITQQAKIRFEA